MNLIAIYCCCLQYKIYLGIQPLAFIFNFMRIKCFGGKNWNIFITLSFQFISFMFLQSEPEAINLILDSTYSVERETKEIWQVSLSVLIWPIKLEGFSPQGSWFVAVEGQGIIFAKLVSLTIIISDGSRPFFLSQLSFFSGYRKYKLIIRNT